MAAYGKRPIVPHVLTGTVYYATLSRQLDDFDFHPREIISLKLLAFSLSRIEHGAVYSLANMHKTKLLDIRENKEI